MLHVNCSNPLLNNQLNYIIMATAKETELFLNENVMPLTETNGWINFTLTQEVINKIKELSENFVFNIKTNDNSTLIAKRSAELFFTSNSSRSRESKDWCGESDKTWL